MMRLSAPFPITPEAYALTSSAEGSQPSKTACHISREGSATVPLRAIRRRPCYVSQKNWLLVDMIYPSESHDNLAA
jgi:hypothetical protein